jgi:hypothetical protein
LFILHPRRTNQEALWKKPGSMRSRAFLINRRALY